MACHLFGAKPFLNQCWLIVIWTLRNKLQWNLNQNTKLFIHENAFENVVCELAAILSRGRWVNIGLANVFYRKRPHGVSPALKVSFLPEASFGLRILRVSVRQSLACPHDNSGPAQARITKFGPNMQNTLIKGSIVLWSDQPWTWRSNLTWKSKFTPFWSCPHHNSSPIQARITKFWPEVQNNLDKIPIVLGGNWPWPSRSNST